MAGMVWLGIALAVFASMTGTIGKQCLRISQLQHEEGTTSAIFKAKVYLACGYLLNIVVGPLVDMGSYAFAPQSVIAPLGGLDVVWNTMSAPCTLGERLTPSLVLGCLLISGGATGTSFFGSKEDKAFDMEELRRTFFRWAVLVYLLVFTAWVAFNVIVLQPRSAAPKGEPFKTGDKWRGLSLGMTAGSLSGNMFCVKAFVEIVQASISEGNVDYWFDWMPYMMLAGAAFFATSNLYFLTKAMREYEALFMGAVFEGTLIVAACLSGVIVFSELDTLQVWQIAVYWAAVSGIVGGIFTVAYGCMQGRDHVEDAVWPDSVAVSEVPDISVPDVLKIPEEDPPLPGIKTHPSGRSLRSTRTDSRSTTISDSPFREVPMIFAEISKRRPSFRMPPAFTSEASGLAPTPPAIAWPERNR